ncbi:uncharacterized protein LOC143615649 [Bidens hawaiensis]|uniref:uncharacterized protein LOC143615649 n=1 Tax=Bidens hawaiensis TaxID=980011 RepID=UPI00404A3A78
MLTRKDKKFIWKDEQEKTFRLLKEKLTRAPVLTLPDGNDDMVVYSDASQLGLGCVLMQRDPGGTSRSGKREELEKRTREGLVKDIVDGKNGMKYRFGRIWVLNTCGVEDLLLDEAHKSRYSVHPGATKMYRDLKQNYWWPEMKRDVAKYVKKFLTCLQVKAEHQKSYGKLQPLDIPVWKWEHITMDLLPKLPRTARGFDAIWVVVDRLTKSAHFIPIREKYTSERCRSYHSSIGMPPYEMLYGRKCRTPVCWGEVGPRKLAHKDVVRATNKKIDAVRAHLKAAHDRQKSYADKS